MSDSEISMRWNNAAWSIGEYLQTKEEKNSERDGFLTS